MLAVVTAGVRLPPPAWFKQSMIPSREIDDTMRQITTAERPPFVVVDGNNVRGRINFRLSKVQLAVLLGSWAERHGLRHRVVVCWDHAVRTEAFEWRGVCHAFAGPRRSADDLIALEALPCLLSSDDAARAWVITTDREPLLRCKSAAAASADSRKAGCASWARPSWSRC